MARTHVTNASWRIDVYMSDMKHDRPDKGKAQWIFEIDRF
jgi:hypothetical protein